METSALAIIYPKVGTVLRVPLRRTATGDAAGCAQHPERQLVRWLHRMAAARPGFPLQVKSILLLTDEPLCASCRRTLARYLGQQGLAGRLRLRAVGGGDGASAWRAATWLEELLEETDPKPAAPGIPEGLLGNTVYPSRASAYQGALAEARRLQSVDPQATYSVVHDADQFSTHYHVVRDGNRITGHFMYGRPSHRVLRKAQPPLALADLSSGERQQINAARASKAASRRQRRRFGQRKLAQELPASLRRAGRIGRFILGMAGAATNPSPDAAPIPGTLVNGATAAGERIKVENQVNDNAAPRGLQSPAGPPPPPPRFPARLPPRGSHPMQLWPPLSQGWRSR